MLEFGARFTDTFYVKVGINGEDPTENFVIIETFDGDGDPLTLEGAITWDDGELG